MTVVMAKRKKNAAGSRAMASRRGRPGGLSRMSARTPAKATPMPKDRQAGESRALGDELAENAAARCAERGANRKFAAPLRCRGEQQVDHVDAGDGQHQENGAGDGQERGLDGVGNASWSRSTIRPCSSEAQAGRGYSGQGVRAICAISLILPGLRQCLA